MFSILRTRQSACPHWSRAVCWPWFALNDVYLLLSVRTTFSYLLYLLSTLFDICTMPFIHYSCLQLRNQVLHIFQIEDGLPVYWIFGLYLDFTSPSAAFCCFWSSAWWKAGNWELWDSDTSRSSPVHFSLLRSAGNVKKVVGFVLTMHEPGPSIWSVTLPHAFWHTRLPIHRQRNGLNDRIEPRTFVRFLLFAVKCMTVRKYNNEHSKESRMYPKPLDCATLPSLMLEVFRLETTKTLGRRREATRESILREQLDNGATIGHAVT